MTGSYGNVLLSVWTYRSTLQWLRLMREASETMVAEHPDGFATLTLLTMEKNTLSNAAERAAQEALHRDFARYKVAEAMVTERGGLVGAAMRTIMMGLSLLHRTDYPTKIFDRVPDAAMWVAPYAKNIDAASLERAIRRLAEKKHS